MARRIATTTAVELDGLLEFVGTRHRMVLLTRRADGRPQASPVAGGMDEEGRVVISTYPQRAKVQNIRQRPQVSVLVLSDEWDGPWIQIDGTAEVVEAAEDVEPFVEYYRTISGEHPDWDEYREAMREQGKVLIQVTPERWSPVATGGFPAELV